MQTPILYSFRRCPYCMRAHMALKYAGIKVELREVKLSCLPNELTSISSADTVPVLLLPDSTVFTESWDIVKWALTQNDPEAWQGKDKEFLLDAEMLIETNDYSFKTDLDHYKYADRHPEHSVEHYREACEEYLVEIEELLSDTHYLLSNQISLADIGVFPYIRQFSLVDKTWFDAAPYPKTQKWLSSLLATELFEDVFQKHDLWKTNDDAIYI